MALGETTVGVTVPEGVAVGALAVGETVGVERRDVRPTAQRARFVDTGQRARRSGDRRQGLLGPQQGQAARGRQQDGSDIAAAMTLRTMTPPREGNRTKCYLAGSSLNSGSRHDSRHIRAERPGHLCKQPEPHARHLMKMRFPSCRRHGTFRMKVLICIPNAPLRSLNRQPAPGWRAPPSCALGER